MDEIERKFLITDGFDPAGVEGARIVQGYLSLDPARSVRVRVAGDEAWLTVKGKARGIRRAEFEYPVPADEGRALLGLCTASLIEKTRYRIPAGPHVWEVDVFEGANAGLVVAEIELGHEDEDFESPPWLGPEVSDDPRYANLSLAQSPFRDWA